MIEKLTRDPDYILKNLEIDSSGQIITKKDCKIQIPEHFRDKHLVDEEVEPNLLGLLCIIMDDKYGVLSVTTKVRFSSSAQPRRDVVNNVPYLSYLFNAGDVLITSYEVFKQDDLIYYITDELIFRAKVPWYFSYDDLGKLLMTCKEYNGADILACDEVNELLASMLARQKNQRNKYWRNSDMKDPPVFVPLASVFYGPTNTVNKLVGAYFGDGVVSALATPTTELERIDSILRV